MGLRRERNLTTEFALVLIILILIGIASYRGTNNLIQANRIIEEKRSLIKEIRDIREQFLEFELSLRDSVLTGHGYRIDPYKTVVEREIGDVRPLVAGDDQQRARLQRITSLAEHEFTALNTALMIPGTTTESIRNLILNHRQYLARIHDALKTMEAHENELLLHAMARTITTDRRTTAVIIVGTSLAFAVICFAGILISLELIDRRRHEKRLNRELQQLLSIFDGVDESVYVADPETYEIIFANQQILKNFGSVVGKKCYRVLQGRQDPCPFCTNDKIFGKNVGHSYVWEIRNHKDKRWYRCLDKAIRWPDGRMVRCEIAIDITEAKHAEERIRTLNRELQDYVERLNEANKDLETFTYSVTHDLKIPLIVIGGFARNLAEGDETISEKARGFLQTITTEVRKMEQLIQHLLEFSLLKQKEMANEPVDMRRLAETVFAEVRRSVPEDRLIEFVLREMPAAHGDSEMLREVFLNLFSNAMKFTGPKEIGRIEAGGASAAGENTYYIRDNGIGFDPAQATRIFDCFHRLHKEKEFQGTGVGLAIVHRIINRHGGRIWAEGEPGKGATFYFTLPGVTTQSP